MLGNVLLQTEYLDTPRLITSQEGFSEWAFAHDGQCVPSGSCSLLRFLSRSLSQTSTLDLYFQMSPKNSSAPYTILSQTHFQFHNPYHDTPANRIPRPLGSPISFPTSPARSTFCPGTPSSSTTMQNDDAAMDHDDEGRSHNYNDYHILHCQPSKWWLGTDSVKVMRLRVKADGLSDMTSQDIMKVVSGMNQDAICYLNRYMGEQMSLTGKSLALGSIELSHIEYGQVECARRITVTFGLDEDWIRGANIWNGRFWYIYIPWKVGLDTQPLEAYFSDTVEREAWCQKFISFRLQSSVKRIFSVLKNPISISTPGFSSTLSSFMSLIWTPIQLDFVTLSHASDDNRRRNYTNKRRQNQYSSYHPPPSPYISTPQGRATFDRFCRKPLHNLRASFSYTIYRIEYGLICFKLLTNSFSAKKRVPSPGGGLWGSTMVHFQNSVRVN
ncbi:hypothetical protein BJ508DRAFT_311976 [Ascobolus immersus RN42]|uniref:Uncharacterized protein n=1 Tax=Ascobolus immersus RN42 TaxID=1160509 RepID=A0A3N4I0R9_ASCIM|nr:hypothetical protein BJ508DRAFT_311976 [Ascobolus immersus RN42]